MKRISKGEKLMEKSNENNQMKIIKLKQWNQKKQMKTYQLYDPLVIHQLCESKFQKSTSDWFYELEWRW